MKNIRTNACAAFAVLSAIVTTVAAQVTYRPIQGDPVRVDGGLVSGTYLPSEVRGYFGVPFAAPPVRENRWREPQPVKPWAGILTANRKAPECVQRLRSTDINHYFGEETASEDCLYLNIWAPSNARAGRKLPVVVWIYGGAFYGGSSSLPLYSGEQLAKKAVVYVAANYRLGLFGFIAHPEATKESGHNASGNWGFLDQVAALKWVSRNIAKFGGDPHNVTIIGQSAGSMSVTDLQASPLARGLFHRAVGMSGSTIAGFGSDVVTLSEGEEQGLKLQRALKASSLAHMRTFSSDKVVAASEAGGVRMGPVIDGYFLPKSPKEIFGAGQQNDVPIFVGSTANDIGTEVPILKAKSAAEYHSAAETMYGPKAAEFLSLYPGSSDEQARASAEQAAGGYGAVGVWAWAQAQATTGKAPAYMFLFARTHPYAPGVRFSDLDSDTAGVYHTADVPYWLQTQDAFNLFRTTRNWTLYDRELSEKMSDAIVNFARTGTPSAAGVTVPRFDPNNPQRIVFGDSIKVENVNHKGMAFILANPPAPPSGSPGPSAAPARPAEPAPAARPGGDRPTY